MSNLLAAAAAGGRIAMPKPTLTHHTSAGQFRITNYNAAYTYTATATGGTATIVGDIVTLSAVNSSASIAVSYAKGLPGQNGYCERKAYTYTDGGQSCSPNCGVVNGTNCFNGTGSCWCGSCAADGTICCGGCYGQTCVDNPDIKDNYSSQGYTDSYGEWWKVG